LKIKLIILFIFLSLFGNFSSFASENIIYNTDGEHTGIFQKKKYKHYKKTAFKIKNKNFTEKTKEKTKGGAILMAILTGPIGGHRIYLGTTPFVPIVYALTLGGGMGLLPAIDLIVILLSKDLNNYENNPNIFMW